jgi:hypothetical protein
VQDRVVATRDNQHPGIEVGSVGMAGVASQAAAEFRCMAAVGAATRVG